MIIDKCCDEVLVSEVETDLVAGRAVIKVVGYVRWRKKGGEDGGQY